MTAHHLAQVNIARLLAPLDSPQLAGFVARLAEINALADRAPGFVWRLQTPEGNATELRPYDDDRIIVNMSVWETVESLHAFVYRSDHVAVMRQRRAWFEQMTDPFMVLWWVPVGHIPSVDEAKARLAHLRAHGESGAAFTFKRPFPPPSAEPDTPLATLPDECRAT
jgi:heme-degrading monooxygenase HmoA